MTETKTAPKAATARVTVPVKPVATSAANAVTLAATAIAANPIIGAAVVAATVGGAGLVAGGRAIGRARRRRMPALRITPAGRLRSALAGSALGRGAAAGNGRSPLGRTLRDLARAPKTPGGSPAAGATAKPRRTAQRPASTPDGPRSKGSGLPSLDGIVRAVSRGGSTRKRPATVRPGHGGKVSSGISRSVRRGGRAIGRLGAGAIGAGAGLVWRAVRAGGRGGRRSLRGVGRYVRRRFLHQQPTPPPATAPTRPPVAPTVNRPATTTTGIGSSTSTTAAPITTRGQATMANPPLPTPPAPVGPVYTAARQVHAVAVNSQIKGTMELRTEAWEFPHTIQALADAITARVALCTREAVDPAYAAHLAQIGATVQAASQAARTLGPAFDALHDKEIRRITQPRPNEAKWDTTANGRP